MHIIIYVNMHLIRIMLFITCIMQSNVSTIDDCLYLYEMNVTQRLSMEVLATVKQYGYNHSIVLKLPLPKNEAYTLNIIRTTHSRQLLLNPINFSNLL